MDKLPQIGERVKVRENYDGAPWYPTRVEDRTGNQVSIAAPLKGGNIVVFQVGGSLQVHFEKPDAMYSFVAKVAGRRMVQGNLRLYDLEEPSEIQRFQRRQMFRLPLVQELTYRVLSTPYKDDSINKEEQKQCCTKDISGGGVRLVISEELPEGAIVELTFPEDSLGLTLRGEVVNTHIKEGEETLDNKYEYGIKFLDLTRHEQDEIVSFIFEEQRRRRRRELAVQ